MYFKALELVFYFKVFSVATPQNARFYRTSGFEHLLFRKIYNVEFIKARIIATTKFRIK
jgi:hypothetical protein